jgi:hypothetical protein
MSVYERERVKLAREAAEDTHFYTKHVYVFELVVPKALSGPTRHADRRYFPLILAPQSISMSDPFTTNVTPTLGGGVYVEESGVLTRNLQIAGDLGWVPKRATELGGSTNPELDFGVTEVGLSFRDERNEHGLARTLSGPAQLQYLQDRIFRLYGDLKKHPIYNKDTHLIWHNFKDQEHWLVVPQNFSINRSAERPLSYPYSISLLILGTADEIEEGMFEDEEDGGWLKKLMKDVQNVREAIRGISAEMRRLTRTFRDGVRGFSSAISGIIDDSIGLMDTATAIVNDAVDLVNTPAHITNKLLVDIDSATYRLLETLGSSGASIVHAYENIGRSVERMRLLTLGTDLADPDERIAGFSRRYGTAALTTSVLTAAEASPALDTTEAFANSGTALMPGDQDSIAQIDKDLEDSVPPPKSIFEYRLLSGDTLRGLAARFLGSASRWHEIAAINKLSAPYISIHGAAGTLKPGDTILLPSQNPPTAVTNVRGVLGVSSRDDKHVRLYGSDLRMEQAFGDKQYDLQLDLAASGEDIQVTSGIDNLKQGIRTRVITERGTDLLYKRVGLLPVVGVGLREVDHELLRLHVARGVTADPRVSAVSNVRLGTAPGAADSVSVELDAIVVGQHDPTVVYAEIN